MQIVADDITALTTHTHEAELLDDKEIPVLSGDSNFVSIYTACSVT